jgi:hypothetical protein
MELALFALIFVGSSATAVLPLFAHWVTLQPQSVDDISKFVPDLIPLPSERIVLAPSAVRVRARN